MKRLLAIILAAVLSFVMLSATISAAPPTLNSVSGGYQVFTSMGSRLEYAFTAVQTDAFGHARGQYQWEVWAPNGAHVKTHIDV